jgi:hypothetical protein
MDVEVQWHGALAPAFSYLLPIPDLPWVEGHSTLSEAVMAARVSPSPGGVAYTAIYEYRTSLHYMHYSCYH